MWERGREGSRASAAARSAFNAAQALESESKARQPTDQRGPCASTTRLEYQRPEVYVAMTEEEKSNAERAFKLGSKYYEEGNLEKARRFFQKSKGLHPLPGVDRKLTVVNMRIKQAARRASQAEAKQRASSSSSASASGQARRRSTMPSRSSSAASSAAASSGGSSTGGSSSGQFGCVSANGRRGGRGGG